MVLFYIPLPFLFLYLPLNKFSLLNPCDYDKIIWKPFNKKAAVIV